MGRDKYGPSIAVKAVGEILEKERYIPHKEAMKTDAVFQSACNAIDLKQTSRQYSKWRRKVGAAYLHHQHGTK